MIAGLSSLEDEGAGYFAAETVGAAPDSLDTLQADMGKPPPPLPLPRILSFIQFAFMWRLTGFYDITSQCLSRSLPGKGHFQVSPVRLALGKARLDIGHCLIWERVEWGEGGPYSPPYSSLFLLMRQISCRETTRGREGQ